MNDILPLPLVPTDQPETLTAPVSEAGVPAVDPVRSAAGRLGGQRVHQLAELGREYERRHRLSPGRQRLKQLVQLGRKYEQENGLAPARKKRVRGGDPWADFLAALARVVKPQHRPAVEQLAHQLAPADRACAA